MDIGSFVVNGDRTNVDINDTAAEILQLCNGYRNMEAIIREIAQKYDASTDITRINVQEFLLPLLNLGIIIDEKEEMDIRRVKGSEDVHYPDHIIWELTSACPLRCRHCYLPSKQHKFIDSENINKIMNLIEETGVYSVQLTGGEALLHPEIERITEQLCALNIQIALSTSGVILNSRARKVVQRLKKHGSVRVSIDGTEYYHNDIRQNADAYQNSIKFIQYAVQKQVLCQVATVLISQPLSMIEEHICLMRDLGVSVVVLSPVSLQGEAERSKLKPLYNMSNVCKLIQKLNEKYATDTFMIQKPADMSQRNCGCGHRIIRIRPDLSITPCPMIETTMGILNEKEYSEILIKKAPIFYDHYSPGIEICGSCDKQCECKNCTAFAIQVKEQSDNCFWAAYQPNFICSL